MVIKTIELLSRFNFKMGLEEIQIFLDTIKIYFSSYRRKDENICKLFDVIGCGFETLKQFPSSIVS